MSDYKKNLLSSLIFLCVGIAMMIVIPISIPAEVKTEVGPRAFPYFVAVCMIALSALLLVSTLFEYRKQRPQGEKAAEKDPEYLRNEIRALVLFVLVLLYIFFFDKIGYFLSTFLASTLTLLLFRVKKVWYYLIVYAAGTGIYFAFTQLLYVTLP